MTLLPGWSDRFGTSGRALNGRDIVPHGQAGPLRCLTRFTRMASPRDPNQVTKTRQRELAIEHLLFQTIRELAREAPGLLDRLEESLSHLWDNGPKDSHDDEAVREIARTFIRSLRS